MLGQRGCETEMQHMKNAKWKVRSFAHQAGFTIVSLLPELGTWPCWRTAAGALWTLLLTDNSRVRACLTPTSFSNNFEDILSLCAQTPPCSVGTSDAVQFHTVHGKELHSFICLCGLMDFKKTTKAVRTPQCVVTHHFPFYHIPLRSRKQRHLSQQY